MTDHDYLYDSTCGDCVTRRAADALAALPRKTPTSEEQREALAFALCSIQNPLDPEQAWAVTADEFLSDATALIAVGYRLLQPAENPAVEWGTAKTAEDGTLWDVWPASSESDAATAYDADGEPLTSVWRFKESEWHSLPDPTSSTSAKSWEYGTVYKVSPAMDVFTATHSRAHAEKQAAESPTDTEVVRRRRAGSWESVPPTAADEARR